ncbi:hypothetical protein [Roseicyclus persicicus]|uniref:Uncharacterized protein n=1 Tax=Roseicyclus persicicus TaxID=2650661 RepID=A0A7X6JXM6_9RHOB|nr:hypothetical protein [Roseibacterium persicicum]NKX43559.1 hypothetical protein [Roseibacterium persicicum]
MLELPQPLPPGALCDRPDDLLAETLEVTGAHWWTGAGLTADHAGAVTGWAPRLGPVTAVPTAPNTGNARIAAAGDLAGLQCRDGLHCGLVAETVVQDARTVTLAVRYLPSWGEEARTVLTLNTGGAVKKGEDENYLFLSEAEGRITVKDDQGLVEATLPAPAGDQSRLVVVSLDGTRLAVALPGGAEAAATARAPVLSGAASLFFGCRNQRPKLLKTLGGALIADVWLWPGRALLLSDAEADRAPILALRRYRVWTEFA